MKKSTSFSLFIIVIILSFIALCVKNNFVSYYSVDGTGLYLARTKNRIYMTTCPHRFYKNKMLQAWNTSIVSHGRELVTLYVPKEEKPMVVAVNSKTSEGECRGQWILWLPYDIVDTPNMVRVIIKGRSVKSIGGKTRKITRKEINDASDIWPNVANDTVAERAKDLLNQIGSIDSTINYTVIDHSENSKTIILSQNDYIKCYGGIGGIGFFYPFPYFYFHEDFPNTIILQNREDGLVLHCAETFVLQVPYSVCYNEYFSSAMILDFNKQDR